MLTILAIAHVAALVEQVQHEVTHGLTALLVGARWDWLNLFAVATRWPAEPTAWGEIAISGSAALLNILAGAACVGLFHQAAIESRPGTRLFVLYFGAYSLLAGFGYLLVDPLFYRPGDALGDWRQVVALLGGSWGVRLPIILVGVAGTFGSFMWLARSTMSFMAVTDSRHARINAGVSLLILPYAGVNLTFSILSFWHPAGSAGAVLSLFKYWCGYSGFLSAFFIASYWANATPAVPNPTPLPEGVDLRWVIGAALGLVLAALVLLPTLHFR